VKPGAEKFNIHPITLASLLDKRLLLRLDTNSMSMATARLHKLLPEDLASIRADLVCPVPKITHINKILKKAELKIERQGKAYSLVDLSVSLKQEPAAPALSPEQVKEAETNKFWDTVKDLPSLFAPGYEKLDETQKTDIAVRFSKKEPAFVVLNIEGLGITDEYVIYGLLEECSEHAGGAKEIVKKIKDLKIADVDIRTRIAKNCAQNGAAAEVAENIEDWGITDPVASKDLAFLCIKHGAHMEVASNFAKFPITPEASRVEVLEELIRSGLSINVIDQFISYGITRPENKVKIARALLDRDWARGAAFLPERTKTILKVALKIDALQIQDLDMKNRLAAECIVRWLEVRANENAKSRIGDMSGTDLSLLETAAGLLAGRPPYGEIENYRKALQMLSDNLMLKKTSVPGVCAELAEMLYRKLGIRLLRPESPGPGEA
jgi:hypothetical protein